jgi:hypothetical protein
VGWGVVGGGGGSPPCGCSLVAPLLVPPPLVVGGVGPPPSLVLPLSLWGSCGGGRLWLVALSPARRAAVVAPLCHPPVGRLLPLPWCWGVCAAAALLAGGRGAPRASRPLCVRMSFMLVCNLWFQLVRELHMPPSRTPSGRLASRGTALC